MSKYILRFQTWKQIGEDILDQFEKLPQLSQLIFPSRLYKLIGLISDEYIQLNMPNDLSSSVIPVAYRQDGMIDFTLHIDNGMKFTVRLDLVSGANKNAFDNVFVLEISDEHWQSGLVEPRVISTLLEKTIPVLGIEHAILYHEEMIEYRRQPRLNDFATGISFRKELGWYTFFGNRLINLITQERLNNLKTYAQKKEIDGGVLLKLQDDIFDAHNDEHRFKLIEAEKKIGFN